MNWIKVMKDFMKNIINLIKNNLPKTKEIFTTTKFIMLIAVFCFRRDLMAYFEQLTNNSSISFQLFIFCFYRV